MLKLLDTKGKKITASVLIGVLALGGVGAGVNHYVKNSDKDKGESQEPSSNIEQQSEDAFILPAFSIQDENAVAARALHIYDKTDGTVPIDRIVDSIYYVNERPDLMKGPKTWEYCQQIVNDISVLLSTNVVQFKDHLNNCLENKETNDVSGLDIIYSSLFISDSYEDRDKAVQMDKLYNTFISHIKDGRYDVLHDDVKTICDLYLELKSSDLSVTTGFMITNDEGAKLSMFSILLNDDMLKKMSSNDQNTYGESLSSKYTLVNKIDKQPLIDEGLKNGFDATGKNVPSDARNISKNSDGSVDYRSDSHADAANSNNGGSESLDEPKEVEQGGKPLGSVSDSNTPTTSTDEENIKSDVEPTTTVEEEYGYIDENGNWVPIKLSFHYVDSHGYTFNTVVKSLK